MSEPTATPPTPTPAARIHDVRFSGYTGDRSPSWTAPLVLARWSLLRAFGRRRGWSAKFVPYALLTMALIPGIGVLTVRALVSQTSTEQQLPIEILPYSDYLGLIGTLIVLWTALVTPELVCPDIQHRVTSLYFATAVSPRGYVLGKWLASMVALLGMTLLPVLVLWAGNIMFAESVTDAFRADLDNVPRIIGSGVIVAVFFSTLGLAVAALTGRRAYAIGALVGIIIGSAILAGALEAATGNGAAGAVNLVAVPIQLAQQLFVSNDIPVGAFVLSYLVVVGLSAVALVMRFRARR